jgi:hypothetical protein
MTAIVQGLCLTPMAKYGCKRSLYWNYETSGEQLDCPRRGKNVLKRPRASAG